MTYYIITNQMVIFIEKNKKSKCIIEIYYYICRPKHNL